LPAAQQLYDDEVGRVSADQDRAGGFPFAESSVDDSRVDGSAQVDVLARARIATLQARTDETLTLVARGTGKVYQDDYVQVTTKLTGLLDEAFSKANTSPVITEVTSARDNTKAWLAAHDAVRKADDAGDYGGAVRLAIAPVQEGAGTAFDKVDTDLREAIDHTRSSFNTHVSEAGGALGGTVFIVSLLAIVVAVGAASGLWQRLKEYR
jgi:hypothetical protein